MTASGVLRVAVVGRGFTAAVHRAAWSAAEAWTGVGARVVLDTPCWRQAVSHPGVDIVDLCGPAPDDSLGAAAAAASAGCHVVISDAVMSDVVIGDVAAVRGRPVVEVPPSRAVEAGGRTVADLPHRCVPAVSLAREILAAGDIGDLRHVQVRGPVSVAVVDLVLTLTGRRFAAATCAADRGRLDGLLSGGCPVAVRAEGSGRDAADVQVDIAGSDRTVRLDLRRPLTVVVATDDQVFRVLRAPMASHPYPAVFGPPEHPCRTRQAAEHLVVDAAEAITGGREDVPCLADVLEASRVLSQDTGPGDVQRDSVSIEDAMPGQLVRA